MAEFYPAIYNPAYIITNYEPPEASLEPPNTILLSSPDETNNNDDDDDDDQDPPYISPAIAEIIPLPLESDNLSFNPQLSSTESDPSQPSSAFYKSLHNNITTSTKAGKIVANVDIAPLFSNAGVRGMVTNVSHGTFYSRPATLIVFSFVFRSGDHGFRFRNANIKVTFSSLPSTTTTGSSSGNTKSSSHNLTTATLTSPSVVKFSPRKIFGLPTHEGKKNTFGGEFSLEVPAGPVTVGPSISFGKEWEYETTHRFSSVGNFWSSKYGTDWDIVYWDIKENKRNGAGIPDRFNCAVVVERGDDADAFVAMTEVTVDTPMGNGFLSRPWSKEKPVVFSKETTFGRQPSSLAFEQLSEDEWRRLAPFDGEWENRFTDEVVRRLTMERLQENQQEIKEGLGLLNAGAGGV